jgi:hypothetical protein
MPLRWPLGNLNLRTPHVRPSPSLGHLLGVDRGEDHQSPTHSAPRIWDTTTHSHPNFGGIRNAFSNHSCSGGQTPKSISDAVKICRTNVQMTSHSASSAIQTPRARTSDECDPINWGITIASHPL